MLRRSHRFAARAAVLGLCLASSPGRAADGDGAPPDAVAPGWIATLGVSVEAATGGGKSILPSTIDLRRADGPADFGAPDDVFGYGLFERGALEIGPAADIRYADGRLAVDAGAYAQYWAIENRLRLRVEALHNIGADEGGHVTVGSDAVFELRGATASIGPRLTIGDSDYFRTTADTSEGPSSTARFYAGATAAVKMPVNDTLSATIYDEIQMPLSGAGERNGAVQNTIGLELDVSFALPRLR